MKRRTFLQTLLGATALPIAATLPAVAAPEASRPILNLAAIRDLLRPGLGDLYDQGYDTDIFVNYPADKLLDILRQFPTRKNENLGACVLNGGLHGLS